MFKFISRLLRFAGRDAWKLRLSVLLGFIEGTLQNVPVFAALMVFMKITEGKLTVRDGWTAFFMVLSSLALRWILRRVFIGLQSDAAVQVAARERLRAGDLFKRFPMSYFTEGNIGNVTSVITGELSFVENYGMMKLEEVIAGLVSIALGCAFLLWVDWRVAAASLVFCSLALIVFETIEKVTKRGSKIRAEQTAELSGAVLEYTGGISVIKALRMAGEAAKRMNTAIDNACRNSIFFEESLIGPITRYFDCFGLAVSSVVFLSFWMFFNGALALPLVVMVTLFIFRIFAPAMALAPSSAMMRVMEAGLDRYEELKEIPIIDAEGKDIQLEQFDIVFDQVSFSYEEKETLKNISFTAKERSMTALVGASGSGKTTIANLIVRFWDAQKGAVKIGGVDVREQKCDSLLRYVSMVFQRVYLFHDTIENNIRFGRPEASRDEIIEAAKKARCHDFITALPQGYETAVGEGGSTLSGGEKQRISIARAILKNAPIVLLDEATASVDPDNEKFIQEAINELVYDKTLIIIAHRLSTIKRADQILVIDKGEIVERGKHDALLAAGGQYTKLWQRCQTARSWKIAHG
jgi:ATP-binding cassette subfamily B protein